MTVWDFAAKQAPQIEIPAERAVLSIDLRNDGQLSITRRDVGLEGIADIVIPASFVLHVQMIFPTQLGEDAVCGNSVD